MLPSVVEDTEVPLALLSLGVVDSDKLGVSLLVFFDGVAVTVVELVVELVLVLG